MYGYGTGWGWMMFMPLLWIVLIGLIAWAVVVLAQRSGQGQQQSQVGETPQEILDRRFARGEIDADAYEQARATLAGRPDVR